MASLVGELQSRASSLRAVAIAGLGSAVMLVVAGGPAAAQSSSITFSTTAGTVQNLNPAQGNNAGVNGGRFTFNPPTGTLNPVNAVGNFFQGIAGLVFVNPTSQSLDYTKTNPPGGGNNFNFSATLSSFYFLAAQNSSCSICGPQNAFSAVTTSVGTTASSNPPGNRRRLNVSAGPAPFVFGGGHSGTIAFSAQALTGPGNASPTFEFGNVSFSVIDQANRVPGPLPLLGAATAFGFSRKLRRRVAAAGSVRQG